MKARDRSRKGVTRQQMKRPLCRYWWERRYLQKCNFLYGVGGGGERKRLAPSPEPLQTAFCAIGRNKCTINITLRKCNFLDGVGKEKVGTLLNHFKQLFALLRGIKARLILLHIHSNHEILSQHTNLNKQVFNELQIFCRQNRNNKYEFTDRVPRV